MNWPTFYLICFVVGFALSVLSFLLGAHLPGKFHLPHFGLHHGGHIHIHLPHGGAPAPGNGGGAVKGMEVSPINFATLMAFLTWFGGVGYLLTRYSAVLGLVALLLSVLSGLVGAAIIFAFMAKVLVRPGENMDPADYDMVGVLGRLSVGIRSGGTGEIVYTQGGTRKSAAARGEDAAAIDKGCEVVVTRFEKGIAYVRRWEDMAGDSAADVANEAGKKGS